MKKLIILVSLIALLASGMAFAQVTISGQIQYEVAESFDKDQDATKLTIDEPDVRAIFNVKADDFTSGWIRIRRSAKVSAAAPTGGTTGTPVMDRAYFTTNFLPAFGVKDVPVDLMGTFGLNEYEVRYVGNVEWDITKRFLRNFSTAGTPPTTTYNYSNQNITKWGMMPKISIMKMVDLSAAFSLESETLQHFFTDLVVGAPVGPGTLRGEVAYGINGTKKFDEGWMHFGLAYGMKMGDIGLNFGAGYSLELNDKKNISGYGVGLKGSYGTLAYGFLGLQGYMKNSDLNYDGEPLHNVRIGLGTRPVKEFGLDAGIILYTGSELKKEKDLTKDKELFNTLDVSGVLYVGKANFRLGYLFVPEKEKSIDPWKTDADEKSLYFIATLAY